MRKKSGFTIVEQAIVLVPEFEKVVRKLEQQVTLRGQSKSTLNNYIRRIALFVVHFGRLPEQIDPDEINEYLAALARDPKSPSRSSFSQRDGYAKTHGVRATLLLSLAGNEQKCHCPPIIKKSPLIKPHSPLDTLYNYPKHADKV